jgi:peptidoglycan/LPS O-acetylase OafA/YrhL
VHPNAPVQSRNHNLDIARGLAAFVIAFGHFSWIPTQLELLKLWGLGGSEYSPIKNAIWDAIVSLTAPAQAWVMTFFLLSGYVVESSLRKLPLGRFLARRAIRIYIPATVAYLAWLGFETLIGGNQPADPTSVLLDLLLVGGGLPSMSGNFFLPVIWTLGFELRYYIFAAVLNKFGLGPKHRLVASLLVCLSMSGLNYFGLAAIPHEYITASFGLALIAFGAWMSTSKEPDWNLRPLLLFAICGLLFSKTGQVNYFFDEQSRPLWIALAVFLCALYLPSGSGRIYAAFEYLGQISYSLYLSHFVFGVGAYLLLYPICGTILGILISFATMLLGSIGFYYAVEKPSVALTRKI